MLYKKHNEKAKEMMDELMEEFNDTYETMGSIDTHNGDSYDGFISFSDGSVRAIIPLAIQSFIGCGKYPTFLDKFIDTVQNNAYAESESTKHKTHSDEWYEIYDYELSNIECYLYIELYFYDRKEENLHIKADMKCKYGKQYNSEVSEKLESSIKGLKVTESSNVERGLDILFKRMKNHIIG